MYSFSLYKWLAVFLAVAHFLHLAFMGKDWHNQDDNFRQNGFPRETLQAWWEGMERAVEDRKVRIDFLHVKRRDLTVNITDLHKCIYVEFI